MEADINIYLHHSDYDKPVDDAAHAARAACATEFLAGILMVKYLFFMADFWGKFILISLFFKFYIMFGGEDCRKERKGWLELGRVKGKLSFCREEEWSG